MAIEWEHRLFLLHELKKNAVCAEIGVYEGVYSQYIKDICQPAELHLVDTNFKPAFWEKDFSDCILHEKFFEEIRFEKNYFDWMYLDADHDFSAVLRQLKLCYEYTKTGGIICGDDCASDEDFEKWLHVLSPYHRNLYKSIRYALNIFLKMNKRKVELEYIKNLQFKVRKIK